MEDKENQRDEPHFADPNERFIGVDQKLANLMMQGWVMLGESCPVETCRCPLMRNSQGQKYCCGCEMWHVDQDRPKKQRFGELVALHGKQNIQLKDSTSTELSKINNIEIHFSTNLQQSLQLKLIYLSSLLNNESDLNKTRQILDSIKLCMENIKNAKDL
jgi:uncharacterized Zn finger protein (UPF0148 family)